MLAVLYLYASVPAIYETSVSVSGFGTIGAIYHKLDGAEFRRDISQPYSVVAYRVSFPPDFMLGVQFDTNFSAGMSATLQLLLRDYVEDIYKPQVSMAYLK